jgi:hypothetical protein
MSLKEMCAECERGEVCCEQTCNKQHCEKCIEFRKYSSLRKYSAQEIAEFIGTKDELRIQSFVDRLEEPHKMIDSLDYNWTEEQALTVQLSWCMTDKEFYEYHLKKPSTWNNYPNEMVEGLAGKPHGAMDDQGFEGCFAKEEGKIIFHRWVQDNYDPIREARLEKIKSMTDTELENAWQSHCSLIQGYTMQYFSSKDESLRKKAEQEQALQEEIQSEITRRGKFE